MDIGIDLDETLILNKNNWNGSSSWKLKTNVDKYLPLLFEKHRLHIITARDNEEEVTKIVKNIEDRLNIKFMSITLTNFNNKGSYAKHCKYLIDDNPDYLSDCLDNNVIPILLSRNKNKYKRVYPDYVVCENWKEVYEHIIDLK